MDLISEIVGALSVRSSVYFRASFSAPFAVRVPASEGHIRFHVAGPGRSWVGLSSGESAFFGEGDLVLVPHGSSHVLASGPGIEPEALAEVVAGTRTGDEPVLHHGGGGARADLVCGHFGFGDGLVHPLIASLPPLLHLPASRAGSFAWMPPLLEAAEREARMEAPANQVVAARLSEILFIQVLRAAVELGPEASGFVGQLADPQVARALQAIHEEPAKAWSLESLATLAGASRSVFAERFRSRVGMTPMRYLADWRIRKARTLLSCPGLSVGEVGRRVGYDSEAAFSRAFREAIGEPPGRYRRSLGA